MKRFPGKAAFSLVEVAFAVGVASFCLIMIIALIPTGISANQASVEETEATGLMAGVIADLRSAPVATSSSESSASLVSPRYQIQMPRVTTSVNASKVSFFLTEDGSLSGALNSNANPALNPHFRVSLKFYTPSSGYYGSSTSLGPTRAWILVSWPALSDPVAGSVPSKFSGSVETVVELNRNWLDH